MKKKQLTWEVSAYCCWATGKKGRARGCRGKGIRVTHRFHSDHGKLLLTAVGLFPITQTLVPLSLKIKGSFAHSFLILAKSIFDRSQ
jgi:hypothetical protein